ncbi:signal peptidase II [Pseudarthrobacter sp. P1]|uniref:signal peptidase II n=1 Tax=Pseudarthrobacter sp. P1 TaxID=3418418 RepID=UPI003CF3D2DD
MNDDSPTADASSVPESAPPSQSAASPAATPKRRLWLLVAGFAVLAYVLDQATKFWVTATMVEGQSTPVIGNLLRWYYIRNSGAAFSIGENFTWFFSLVMAAVSVAIISQVRKIGSAWWAVALGLVLGGALGNLTDRLFREPSFGMGHVVDFISFPNFAIFNLADSAVVGGVILICILTLKGIPMRGKSAGND